MKSRFKTGVKESRMDDSMNILASFKGQRDVYLTKPIDRARLLDELPKL